MSFPFGYGFEYGLREFLRFERMQRQTGTAKYIPKQSQRIKNKRKGPKRK